LKILALVVALILSCGTASLPGHELLGPAQINQMLKSIQQSQMKLAGNPAGSEKEEALFTIGVEAYALMKLINSDIREHGAENRGLIELVVNRCKAMGVNFQPAAGKEHYMYDFAAFTAYLALAPRGRHAPEVRFALIEKSFYDEHGGQRTPEVLLKQIQEKKQLLSDFPDLSRRADLEIFVILDYLELHSYFEEKKDQAKSTEYRDLALKLCRQVIDEHPDTGAANFARNLLIQFGL
jgi:hypothetical protein